MTTLFWTLLIVGILLGFVMGYLFGKGGAIRTPRYIFTELDYDCLDTVTVTVNGGATGNPKGIYAHASLSPITSDMPPNDATLVEYDGSPRPSIALDNPPAVPSPSNVYFKVWGANFIPKDGNKTC